MKKLKKRCGTYDPARLYDAMERKIPVVCISGMWKDNRITTPDGAVWTLVNMTWCGEAKSVIAMVERSRNGGWSASRIAELTEVLD